MRDYRQLFSNINSWSEFCSSIQKFTHKEKGDVFEYITKCFLELNPTYRSLLKHVWLLDDVPSSVREHLNLPSTDQGIDIVAQTKTGEYWAIQCKYREDVLFPLTWREISTFTGLTFGICKNINFSILVTSGERYPKILKRKERIGFLTSEVWGSLGKEFFDELRAHQNHKNDKPIPRTPRPHQALAIKETTNYFKNNTHTRGKLIMPCATGKSLAAFWIAEELKAKTILVVVPSLALMRQSLFDWLRELEAKPRTPSLSWLCVCSDETVSEVKDDSLVDSVADLGIPCVTDKSSILNWFEKTNNSQLRIVFTTYQSGKVIATAAKQIGFSFDIGIFDEAHKTVGDKNKLFAHLLFDENIEIRRRLFMTATERRFNGKTDTVLSMDNPAIFGETCHLLTFKDAIEAQPLILSDYEILTILVSRKDIAELVARNRFVRPVTGRWNEEIEASMLAALVALRKAFKEYPVTHAVSFHASIARASIFQRNCVEFNNLFPEFGEIDTFHVRGTTPAAERGRVLAEFASNPKALITNARCLTEGVDVPKIDCVLFADPRQSTVDIVQAVGRALRLSTNKKLGYVIVPVLLNDEDSTDATAFETILSVVRALASNDERIVEYFRAIYEKRRSSSGIRIRIIGSENIAKTISLENFVQAVELRVWQKLAKLSWRPFTEAREFVRSLGLKSNAEWNKYCIDTIAGLSPKPPDIPTAPYLVYKEEWQGWGDWLGTQNKRQRRGNWRPFTEAREFARSLGLKSASEWHLYFIDKMTGLSPKPPDIPTAPYLVYKEEWQGWGDWLGTQNIRPKIGGKKPFSKAREFARSLALNGQKEWRQYCSGKIPGQSPRPLEIPSHPDRFYKEEWQGWGDWLGKTKGNR